MLNQSVPRTSEVDPRTLVPHFTVRLAMELRDRLKRRILEDGVESHWRKVYFPHFGEKLIRSVMTPELADELARDIVRKMYLTQIKEAKAIISFSKAVIDYNAERVEAANSKADAMLGKRAAHLSRTFRNQRHREE
jgi:hypothetical protein